MSGDHRDHDVDDGARSVGKGTDGEAATAGDPDEPAGSVDEGSKPPEPGTVDAVEAELRKVRDPERELSVFEAGLIEDVHVGEDRATIEADLSAFPPEGADAVSAAMVRAATDAPGVERAHVEHVSSRTAPGDREAGVGAADRVIAVASAKGGVGKSTVATTLACALAADDVDVGIFDADVYGPNVPELLEASGPVHSDDDGNPIPVDAGGVEVMSVGLLSSDAPLAWRGAMAHDALSELFEETAWADPDVLVIDLPPGTGDVALTTLQDVPVDGVVFVTTPFHAAVSDTHRSLQLFEENDVPVLGVVANMDEFVCEACGEPHDLFGEGDPVEELEAPVLERIPFSGDLQDTPAATDAGVPDVGHSLASHVQERLEEIWSVEVPDGAVDLRGVPSEDRHDRVAEGVERVDPDEPLYIVSDRDPSPVSEYLRELTSDAPPEERFEGVDVKRQNPETWFLRARRA